MIVNDYDADFCEIDGVILPRLYQSRAFGAFKVLIYDVYSHHELKKEEPFNEVVINGVTYGTQAETVNELNKVIYL